MPQMNKGGKFVFGESVIRPDGWVRLPPQAAEEYRIASEGKAYLFTGSKMTGGFCVTRQGLLLSVRSSDIAFTMGAKGPLLEKAAQLDGEIPQF